MAYSFHTDATASFKVKERGKDKSATFKGINSAETSAQVICDGIAALLIIAGKQGNFEEAQRVVTEDVYDDEA